MKQRTRKRFCLALLALAALLLTAAGSLYWYSRPPAPPTFKFLAGQQPCHERIWKAGLTYAQTSYSFSAYYDSIYPSARRELLALGYTEVTTPIDDSSADRRFDPRHMGVTSLFQKRAGRTLLNVRFGKGRFLETHPNEAPRFALDPGWVNVVIVHATEPFSLKRQLQKWWNNLHRKPAPPPTPAPIPSPPPAAKPPHPSQIDAVILTVADAVALSGAQRSRMGQPNGPKFQISNPSSHLKSPCPTPQSPR
jgi:hypothetical protein